MLNPIQLEEMYLEFTGHLGDWAHDGILSVDLKLLYESGILNEEKGAEDMDDLTQYFHVIENIEKVTLFNEQFIVWIVPKMEEERPVTYVFIALNHEKKPSLEIIFTTAGVYNTPKYVLRVLQHFLIDMLETEATVIAFEKNQ